jgi:hypothetical protein
MTKSIELLRAALFTGALFALPGAALADGDVPNHEEVEEPAVSVSCHEPGNPRDVPDHQQAQSRCGDDSKGVLSGPRTAGDVPDHQEAQDRGGSR